MAETPNVPYDQLTPEAELTDEQKTSFYDKDIFIGWDIIADVKHPRRKFFTDEELEHMRVLNQVLDGNDDDLIESCLVDQARSGISDIIASSDFANDEE